MNRSQRILGVSIVVALTVSSLVAWHLADQPCHTGRPLDIAIIGAGYLTLCDEESGETSFTRYDRLAIASDGSLVVGRNPVEPPIVIPDDWQDVVISPDGYVLGKHARWPDYVQAGSFQLARLDRGPNGRFVSFGHPGDPEFGSIRQNWINAASLRTNPMRTEPVLFDVAARGSGVVDVRDAGQITPP